MRKFAMLHKILVGGVSCNICHRTGLSPLVYMTQHWQSCQVKRKD